MRKSLTPAEQLIERYRSLGNFVGSTHSNTPEQALADAAEVIESRIREELWCGPTTDECVLAWRMTELAEMIETYDMDPDISRRAALVVADLMALVAKGSAKSEKQKAA